MRSIGFLLFTPMSLASRTHSLGRAASRGLVARIARGHARRSGPGRRGQLQALGSLRAGLRSRHHAWLPAELRGMGQLAGHGEARARVAVERARGRRASRHRVLRSARAPLGASPQRTLRHASRRSKFSAQRHRTRSPKARADRLLPFSCAASQSVRQVSLFARLLKRPERVTRRCWDHYDSEHVRTAAARRRPERRRQRLRGDHARCTARGARSRVVGRARGGRGARLYCMSRRRRERSPH